jgi:hypothetical protein
VDLVASSFSQDISLLCCHWNTTLIVLVTIGFWEYLCSIFSLRFKSINLVLNLKLFFVLLFYGSYWTSYTTWSLQNSFWCLLLLFYLRYTNIVFYIHNFDAWMEALFGLYIMICCSTCAWKFELLCDYFVICYSFLPYILAFEFSFCSDHDSNDSFSL